MEGEKSEMIGSEDVVLIPRCLKVPEDRFADDAEEIVARERRRRLSDD